MAMMTDEMQRLFFNQMGSNPFHNALGQQGITGLAQALGGPVRAPQQAPAGTYSPPKPEEPNLVLLLEDDE